jgi:beta-mannosidase
MLQPWSCCARPAGSIIHPDQLAAVGTWLPAPVPGTAAAALQASGQWDLGQPYDFDSEDWWFRTAFADARAPCRLRFDGLATLAEVWLNGQQLLTTANMFRSFCIDVSPYLRKDNELVLGFRSLAAELRKKRPRPRWKTNLVSQQQLRWLRTTLLGRIPGWSPPVAPVGPWRVVQLDPLPLAVTDWQLTSRLNGDDGVVMLRGQVRSAAPIRSARLQVAGHDSAVKASANGDGWLLHAELPVGKPALWWPHTHGDQPLFPCTVQLSTADAEYAIDGGKIGFRRLDVRQDGGFALFVNEEPVYCRGACWTVSDIVRLGNDDSLEHDLRLACDAGINMLRIGGTMLYESDRFYELCDELGILVWQDFMFANMDYPVDDAEFTANSEAEARAQLARLTPHPSLAVFCGNSEVEQQAAMLGMPRDSWRNHWFGDRLRQLCGDYCPDAAYIPSTPSGGVLPFHVRDGIAHYYGIGAYRRTPAELRQADVKFSSECLGFSHIPEPETVNRVMGGALPALHHPRWKQRVPRDTGPGWDFEDIRDYYLQHLFTVDPVGLRSFDMPRYLQLSRVVPGEMLRQVFAEWRGGHSHNQGGLVWFYKDLWPGAGWGIVDSLGVPKAAYYYLKRCWQPRQLTVTDEGLEGLHLHVSNELSEPLLGHVELLLLQEGHVVVARCETACELPPRGRRTLSSDALLGRFCDVTYAYRFGPSQHNLAIATLFDEQQRVVSEAFHFVTPREPAYLGVVKLEAEAEQAAPGQCAVYLQADRFLQAVRFDAPGYLPSDNYFHLTPGRSKKVDFTAVTDRAPPFRANLEALNLRNSVMVRLKDAPC